MALTRMELHIGGMEGRQDIQVIRAVLDKIEGIDAQDIRAGLVRVEFDTTKVSSNTILAAIANAGEGYDVSMF
jgi:copper chaperone CopZ